MAVSLKCIGFALLLAGCTVTTPSWVKPGAGPGEFAADKTFCDNRSSAMSSVHLSSGFAGQGAFEDCMRARGWNPPGGAPPVARP